MFYQQKCMKKLCIFAVPVREDGVDLSSGAKSHWKVRTGSGRSVYCKILPV